MRLFHHAIEGGYEPNHLFIIIKSYSGDYSISNDYLQATPSRKGIVVQCTWSKTSYEDLMEYLIISRANEGQEIQGFCALYSYNYVQNGSLGDV